MFGRPEPSGTYTKSVIAQELGTAGTHSAEFQLGYGVWEIVSCHVIIGGDVTIVTVTTVRGFGDVRFENEHNQDGSYRASKSSPRLVAGWCDIRHALMSDGPRRVNGPGQIKSYIQQDDSAQHTLTVTFRRVGE